MTREELEREIASIAGDIEILNRKIAEAIEFAKERDRLRIKMSDLLRQYLGECFREKLESHNVVFAFNGKIKDLLADLKTEIQKAKI